MGKFYLVLLIMLVLVSNCFGGNSNEDELSDLRNKVKDMFYHAYNGYLERGYPYDELRPLTCDGVNTWGSFSLTLVDALDTLAVLGNYSEFRRVANELTNNIDFNINVNVSVFETNIRVVGGLLSAHLMADKAGLELTPGWPCSGPLLDLAVDVADRLLPAFNTPTYMPFGTVNLRYGVDANETPITCTAGVGTFIVEFATLSRLTGDAKYEEIAMKAIHALNQSRSNIGLLGNHINVITGKWTALDSGIGAGVDSFYEYLVKGSILLDMPELMEMFKEFLGPIEKYLKQGDWYMWANMNTGSITLPIHQSLEAFWPGLQTLYGDTENAYKTILSYYDVWDKYGGTPEFYSITQSEPFNGREGYPLRPELIESTMYLYKSNKDPRLLEFGKQLLRSIEKVAKTNCGYATVKDVRDHRLDNRMESFFLAETIKYLYLLFDPENPLLTTMKGASLREFGDGRECILGAGGYIFNTEAHPIDVSALHCCDIMRKDTENSNIWNTFKSFDAKTLFTVNRSGWEPNPEPSGQRTWAGSDDRNVSRLVTNCDAESYHMKFMKHGQIFTEA
uniref:ER degradation-enhancing alpha-mannosidase-like protein 2 n=1 Tax=Ciona intestinalis TaxID=7719 RepID=UPI000180C5D6|nr:ER degradation-enhancing alpha-mannosidase-like protein 2 [Ciona intestinalis]|eukprot:XP_002127890.1 ER degradation-enhancing alpha-mannosidase-like protein 2 [Ciona intestinalis]